MVIGNRRSSGNFYTTCKEAHVEKKILRGKGEQPAARGQERGKSVHSDGRLRFPATNKRRLIIKDDNDEGQVSNRERKSRRLSRVRGVGKKKVFRMEPGGKITFETENDAQEKEVSEIYGKKKIH